MRTKPLWWIVIVLGVAIAVFSLWTRRAGAPGASTEQSSPTRHVTVVMRNFVFEPQEITVQVGTTVDWIDTIGEHAIEFDESGATLGKDDVLSVGGSASRTFQTPGRYPYHCAVHGAAGGKGMAGVIVVTAQ